MTKVRRMTKGKRGFVVERGRIKKEIAVTFSDRARQQLTRDAMGADGEQALAYGFAEDIIEFSKTVPRPAKDEAIGKELYATIEGKDTSMYMVSVVDRPARYDVYILVPGESDAPSSTWSRHI